MNVWTDWIAPAVTLLAMVAALAAVVVAGRRRRAAEHAADRAATSARDAADLAQQAQHLLEAGRGERDLAAATVVHVPLPQRHDPPGTGELSATCASGEHPWARRDITNVRRPGGDDSERLLCSVTWHCGACPATRHEQNVPPPLTLAVAQAGLTPTVAARAGVALEPEVTAS